MFGYNKKKEGISMSKITIVSSCSALFFLVSSLTHVLLIDTKLMPKTLLIITAIILVISVLFAIICRNSTPVHIFCLFLNGVALGFAIHTWIIYKGYHLSFIQLLGINGLCLAFLWMVYLITKIPIIEQNPLVIKRVVIILVIVSIVAYIFLIIFVKTTWLSTFGYHMIVQLALMIAVYIHSDDLPQLMKSLLLCSYSVIIVAIIIALIVLGGDFDFDVDLDLGGSSKNKKNRKQNTIS